MASALVTPCETIIHRFKRQLEECEVTAVCGSTFVLVDQLKGWLTDTDSEQGISRVQALLQELYGRLDPPILPIQAHSITDTNNTFLLVFSILLKINQGHLISLLHRCDFYDERLPFTGTEHKRLQKELERNGVPDAEEIIDMFDKCQWSFCPFRFEKGQDKYLLSRKILPISKQMTISRKGGTSVIWQIEVLEQFVGAGLRDAAKNARYLLPDSNDARYHFALKIYKHGNIDLYHNEIRAFQALRDNGRMIQYLGSFEHAGKNHILLEYGECDLDEYFHEHHPPVLSSEISDFWADLFEVATAMKGIHTVKLGSGDNEQEYCGMHADIKPDNILLVEKKFKLADPGFAKFVKSKRTGELETHAQQEIQGGTIAFGAPEYGRSTHQSLDIWSLGCVFSIAATWVVLGIPGIAQFEFVRGQASVARKKRESEAAASSNVQLYEDESFHDGQNVLTEVTDWHRHLREVQRGSDTITEKVLQLVDERMLCGSPKSRINAKRLCEQLSNIMKRSKLEPQISVPTSLHSIFEQMESQAAEAAEATNSAQHFPPTGNELLAHGPATDRKARKSQKLSIYLKPTTHRSIALKTVELHPQETSEPSTLGGAQPLPPRLDSSVGRYNMVTRNPASSNPDINIVRRESPEPLPGPNRTSTHTNHSYPTSRGRPHRQSSFRPEHQKQNVWQARAEIDRRRGEDRLKFRRIIRGSKKDKLLSRHFGDRDLHFLVDNAESMQQHWDQTIHLLETLVMKAEGQDENGMDLSFTNGSVYLQDCKESSKFRDRTEDERARPYESTHTHIGQALGKIMTEYLQKVDNWKRGFSSRAMRKLTVIVLTDGIWAGMDGDHALIAQKIKDFYKNLVKCQGNDLQERQVTFEFVQLGNDPNARQRLRHLDDEIEGYGIPDIVDTEDALGDVNKMLLGSFVEAYDKDEKEEDDHDIIDDIRTMSVGPSRRQFSTSPRPESSISSPPLVPVESGNYPMSPANASYSYISRGSITNEGLASAQGPRHSSSTLPEEIRLFSTPRTSQPIPSYTQGQPSHQPQDADSPVWPSPVRENRHDYNIRYQGAQQR